MGKFVDLLGQKFGKLTVIKRLENDNSLKKCYMQPNFCKDITDCLLKQIVNKCQSVKDKGVCMSRYGVKVPVSEGWDLASEILELLEIKECENE